MDCIFKDSWYILSCHFPEKLYWFHIPSSILCEASFLKLTFSGNGLKRMALVVGALSGPVVDFWEFGRGPWEKSFCNLPLLNFLSVYTCHFLSTILCQGTYHSWVRSSSWSAQHSAGFQFVQPRSLCFAVWIMEDQRHVKVGQTSSTHLVRPVCKYGSKGGSSLRHVPQCTGYRWNLASAQVPLPVPSTFSYASLHCAVCPCVTQEL